MSRYDEKSKKIFEVMMERGYIPKTGIFEVTDDLLDISVNIGRELFTKNNRTSNKPSTIRFHKKIAGLNFIHLLNERQFKKYSRKEIKPLYKCGFVYVISNPIFENHYKIGITRNIEERIQTYQTYDPLRRYKVEKKIFVEDCSRVERYILSKYKTDIGAGEWISKEFYNEISEYLEEY